MDTKVGGKFRNYITKEELDRYFSKSGYDKLYIKNLIATDWGFASWDLQDDTIFVYSVYGDALLWKTFFTNLAKLLGANEIKFITRRCPKAWARLLKDTEIKEYIMRVKI